MRMHGVLIVLLVAVISMGVSAIPSSGTGSIATPSSVASTPVAVPIDGGSAGLHAAASSSPAATAPAASGFPRQVLIETFTAEWCVYCEEESQAFYQIDHTSGLPAYSVAEIHVCYSPTTCGDNYPSYDNTSIDRMNYYGVGAFPTVIFDGVSRITGAISPTVSGLAQNYTAKIDQASMVPGDVLISQNALMISSSSVRVTANVTSDVSGNYVAISYLLQYIGINDSSHHDIANVVRESVIDTPVTLTAGATTKVTGVGPVLSSWNVSRLSVITFLQNASSRAVLNSNTVAVETMIASVHTSVPQVSSTGQVGVSVHLTSASGTPLSGATIQLSADHGGTFSPSSGMTAVNGSFSSTYSSPQVTSQVLETITAQASLSGQTTAVATTLLTVNPVSAPSSPTGLDLIPSGARSVTLNWTVPSTGGGGVTYQLYRATSSAGPFTMIASPPGTAYTDSALDPATTYWYSVSAQNIGGSSPKTAAVPATAVAVTPVGLPTTTGWWFQVDGWTFNATTASALAFHLPAGQFVYAYGSDAYGYLPTQPSGSTFVGSSLLQIQAQFTPRYATLQGNVTPATATVSVNGTPISVDAHGTFDQPMLAGTYNVSITAYGYVTYSKMVPLTAGNVTPLSVQLVKVSTPPSTSSGTPLVSLSGTSGLVIGAALIAIAAMVGVSVALRMRRPRA